MSEMDFRLEQWINAAGGHHHFLDVVMVALANWSEAAFIALVLTWLGFGVVAHRGDERRHAIAALLASGLALATNQLISMAWIRPRPFAAHPDHVHVLLSHTADASFPSDHVAAAMAIAVVLLSLHRSLGLTTLLLALLVGYARVFVGDHYPGDVVGGALVGLIAGLALLSPQMRAIVRAIDRRAIQDRGTITPGSRVDDGHERPAI